MRLESYITPDRTLIIEDAESVDDLLARLASTVRVGGVDNDTLIEALKKRESDAPTSTPEGVAFPHAMLPEVEDTVVIAALVRPGVAFGARDHPPVDLVFCMIGSSERPWDHVRLLARLARIVRAESALQRLRAAETREQLHEALVSEDRRHG